jgi:hypothetical protein
MTNRYHVDVPEVTNPPSKISSYEFCPERSPKREQRDFIVSLYDDGTLIWDDATKRRKVISAENGFLKAVLGVENEVLSETERPFLIRTNSNIGIRSMFYRLHVFESGRVPFDTETVIPLDDHLEEIFWLEVNPQLPDPLTRRTTGRKPTK